LELGADTTEFKVNFRRARGTDANLPARRWAKAAVRTIEATRLRLFWFSYALRRFASHEVFADFCVEAGWEFGKRPDWVPEVAEVSAFSKKTLPGWKTAIRKMIREQMPNFHTRPEWTTQRNTAAANGRNTPGELQNAILDDIVSALASLAPDNGC
jgi:hypothetical protein